MLGELCYKGVALTPLQDREDDNILTPVRNEYELCGQMGDCVISGDVEQDELTPGKAVIIFDPVTNTKVIDIDFDVYVPEYEMTDNIIISTGNDTMNIPVDMDDVSTNTVDYTHFTKELPDTSIFENCSYFSVRCGNTVHHFRKKTNRLVEDVEKSVRKEEILKKNGESYKKPKFKDIKQTTLVFKRPALPENYSEIMAPVMETKKGRIYGVNNFLTNPRKEIDKTSNKYHEIFGKDDAGHGDAFHGLVKMLAPFISDEELLSNDRNVKISLNIKDLNNSKDIQDILKGKSRLEMGSNLRIYGSPLVANTKNDAGETQAANKVDADVNNNNKNDIESQSKGETSSTSESLQKFIDLPLYDNVTYDEVCALYSALHESSELDKQLKQDIDAIANQNVSSKGNNVQSVSIPVDKIKDFTDAYVKYITSVDKYYSDSEEFNWSQFCMYGGDILVSIPLIKDRNLKVLHVNMQEELKKLSEYLGGDLLKNQEETSYTFPDNTKLGTISGNADKFINSLRGKMIYDELFVIIYTHLDKMIDKLLEKDDKVKHIAEEAHKYLDNWFSKWCDDYKKDFDFWKNNSYKIGGDADEFGFAQLVTCVLSGDKFDPDDIFKNIGENDSFTEEDNKDENVRTFTDGEDTFEIETPNYEYPDSKEMSNDFTHVNDYLVEVINAVNKMLHNVSGNTEYIGIFNKGIENCFERFEGAFERKNVADGDGKFTKEIVVGLWQHMFDDMKNCFNTIFAPNNVEEFKIIKQLNKDLHELAEEANEEIESRVDEFCEKYPKKMNKKALLNLWKGHYKGLQESADEWTNSKFLDSTGTIIYMKNTCEEVISPLIALCLTILYVYDVDEVLTNPRKYFMKDSDNVYTRDTNRVLKDSKQIDLNNGDNLFKLKQSLKRITYNNGTPVFNNFNFLNDKKTFNKDYVKFELIKHPDKKWFLDPEDEKFINAVTLGNVKNFNANNDKFKKAFIDSLDKIARGMTDSAKNK